MPYPVHKHISGSTAVKIAAEIEKAIRDGAVAAGEALPTVRALADDLRVSPATVASAYRAAQTRAFIVSQGRRGTHVAHRPTLAQRTAPALGRRTVNLADGNPDPTLLPDCARSLRRLEYTTHLYGSSLVHPGLAEVVGDEMRSDGIRPGALCVVNGAMDGLDRLVSEHVRSGDRIAVEDPGFTGHHDLMHARGLSLVPVRVDAEGPLPDSLAHACSQRPQALLLTPRAHSPTGAAISPERARALRVVLRRFPEVLVIEDDHASLLCESTPYQRVHDPARRWAHIRSYSKSLNPDLRLAVMTGDDETINPILDRLVVVERWVSMILQSLAHELLTDATVRANVRKAGRVYDQRREALIAALKIHGLAPTGRSGFNVWLPVREETATVQALAAANWSVAAGERFRLAAPPAIRITASRLQPSDARRFATALGAAIGPARGTTAGAGAHV